MKPKRSPLEQARFEAFVLCVLWLFFSAFVIVCVQSEWIMNGRAGPKLLFAQLIITIVTVIGGVRYVIQRRTSTRAAPRASQTDGTPAEHPRTGPTSTPAARALLVFAGATLLYVTALTVPHPVPMTFIHIGYGICAAMFIHFGVGYLNRRSRSA